MTAEELAEELKRFSEVPEIEYADIEAWLNSEETKMIYRGVKGVLTFSDGHEETGTVVRSLTRWGEPYKAIIIDGKLYSVPEAHIREER